MIVGSAPQNFLNFVLEQVGNTPAVGLQLCYSVMQSEGNSFCEDVVLDSFNKVSRDKDSILNQVYEKQIFF